MIDTVPFCRPFELHSGKAETPAKTINVKLANDTDPGDSPARQAALLILDALCRLGVVSPSRIVSDTLFEPRKWMAAMAQL